MPYDLFISYSRRDNAQGRITELVERVKKDFASFEGMQGRELQVFFDQQEIHGMSDWQQRILQGLRESRLLLACLSPAYLQSDYCQWEFVEYLKYEIGHLHGFNGVAPIYFVEVPGWEGKDFEQQCAAWIAELRKRQHFDLRPWHDQGAEALRETAVQERLLKLNRQIVQTITRGERAERSLGNVDAHNPHFIGRTANLRMLRENFVKPGHIGVVTAVNGVGGLGKTALAIEYAHAFADEYGGGRWQVRCAGKDDLRLAMAELATPIGFEFTDGEKKNADLQFERVRRELKKLADAREPHRCLLVLDNVDKPSLLDPAVVARLNAGDWLHVLATTRLGENELHGTHKDRSFLAVDELPEVDALALIESFQPNGHFPNDAEREAAREIVRLLGCFTLAVESAAVYIGQFANDVTCAAFLIRLKKEGLEGLDTAARQGSEGVLHGEKRLSATLQPTLDQLGAAEKLALEFAALLPPDQVPLPWLRALVTRTFPEMERDAEPGYPDPWKNLLRRLFSLHLVQATNELDADNQPLVVRIHRLVGELVRKVSSSDQKRLRDELSAYIKARCDELEYTWHESLWEIPSIITYTREMLTRGDANATSMIRSLCQWLPRYDYGLESEVILRACLAQLEKNPSEDSTDIPVILSNLGWALDEQERHREAEVFFRRALEIDERERPEDKHALAVRYNNLQACLREQGRLLDAEPLCRRALKLAEQALGEEHYGTLTCLGHLAVLLGEKGDYGEAETLMRRCLEISERVFGSEHPAVVRAIIALAGLLKRPDQLVEAENLYRRAIAIDEKIFGPEHRETATDINNLAALLYKANRYAEAETLYRRTLTIWQKNFPDHLVGEKYLNNLAQLLQTTNRLEEAEPLMHRRLEILLNFGHATGHLHQDFQKSINDYTGLLEAIGRSQEEILTTLWKLAPDLCIQASRAFELNNRSDELRKAGKLTEAGRIDRRVVKTIEKLFGDSHLVAIHHRINLVLTLILLGELDEARQVLAADWRLSDPPHANTTPRIAFLRHVIALLESQPDMPFLGQLKTLLTGPELPVASDVAVPWEIAYFIAFLKPKLREHNASFLTALVTVINDRTKLRALDKFPEWHNTVPRPLN